MFLIRINRHFLERETGLSLEMWSVFRFIMVGVNIVTVVVNLWIKI